MKDNVVPFLFWPKTRKVQVPRSEEEAKAMLKVAAIYLQAKKIERGEEGLEYIEVIHKLLGQK